MKKNLLFLLMAFILGGVAANAYNVRWQIDNPENIKVTTNAGNGHELAIENDMSTVEDSDNPLLIEGNNGATITSLSLNMSPVNPSGDGAYRIGITGNSMIQITTEGGSATQTVAPYFFIMADDNNSASAIITYGDGLQVTNGQQATVDKDTRFNIAPAAAYEITGVECSGGNASANGDGTYTYTATAQTDYVYVYTKGNGVKFTLNIDFAPNISVFTGVGATETETPCTVYTGSNQMNVAAGQDYIQFYPAEGASIVSITRNGESIPSGGYRPWRSMFEAGDIFDVTTEGKAVKASFAVPENNAPLENYTFTAGGRTLELSGMEATADLHLGDVVSVSPRGATNFKYIYGSGTQTIDNNSFRITSENSQIWVYGEKARGVNINVSDAAQIVVKQSNGHGETLTLQTGLNNFALSSLGDPLQIMAAEGCEILSVTLDGKALVKQNNGSYIAELSEGCYIEINSREIPADVMLTVMSMEPGLYEGVELTVNNEVKTLGSDVATLSVPFESVVTVKARFGYILDDVTSASGLAVTAEDGVYRLVADKPGSISLFGKKITASEGEALITVKSDNNSVRFYEYAGEDLLQTLSYDNVNVVKKGNYLKIQLFSSNVYLGKVSVNGTDMDLEKDARSAGFTIDGDAVVSVETYSKVDVATYDATDPVNYSTIGKLYVKVGDELVRNYSAAVGETITFVSETAAGYKLDYIKRLYPESDIEYGTTYTITAEDLEAQSVIFQGVYSVNTETPSYVVRCNQTWIDNELVGWVMILHDGTEVKERRYLEGEQVHLNAYARDDYDTVRFMLWRNNEVTVSNPYTVSGADADAEGVIDICAEFKALSSGTDNIATESSITYNKALQILNAPGSIRLYNASGSLVLTGEGELSLEALQNGVYVAVSGTDVFKFVK